MAKGKSDTKPPTDTLSVPVQFGNFAAGDEVCRLGLRIDANAINQTQANRFLCGARLKVRLAADPNAGQDGQGQAKMLKDETAEVEGVADVKGYTKTPKRYGCGLAFNIADIDTAALLHLSRKAGVLEAERTGEAPEKKRGRPAKEDGDPNQQTFDDDKD